MPEIEPTEPQTVPYTDLVADILRTFTNYALDRQISGDLEKCRRDAKISERTAEVFEENVDRLMPDEDAEADQQAGAA